MDAGGKCSLHTFSVSILQYHILTWGLPKHTPQNAQNTKEKEEGHIEDTYIRLWVLFATNLEKKIILRESVPKIKQESKTTKTRESCEL